MKKRLFLICTILLVVALAIFAFSACDKDSAYGVELVKNGDFSSVYESKFTGWTTMASGVKFLISKEGDNTSLCINNESETFAYLKQTIAVEKNAVYKISLKIKVVGALSSNENAGSAHVSFGENESLNFAIYKNTENEWVDAVFYVSPKNTDALTIELCLGDTDNPAKGKVYFDDVSVVKVKASEVPAGVSVTNFHKVKTVTNVDGAGLAFEIVLIIATVCIVVGVYFGLRRLYARNDVFVNFDNTASNDKTPGNLLAKKGDVKKDKNAKDFFKNTFVVLGWLLLATFAVRLVLLLTTYGIGSRTTIMLQFAQIVKESGMAKFAEIYGGAGGVSQGTLYILNVIGLLKVNSEAASILLRFVNVLADMATVAIIYFYGKKYVGNRLSTVFAGLYALLPITMFFGGMNATFESVLVALMLATIILLIEKKYLLSYFFLALSVVMDPRAMLLLPIVVTYMGYMYYRDAQSLKRFTKNRAMILFGLVGTFVLVYILTIPVALNKIASGDAFYGYKYTASLIALNTTFVENAFNLYAMVGMNCKNYENSAATYLNAAFICVLEVFALSLYFKNRNRQEILLLTSFVLAMTATFTLKTNWTFIFLAIAFAIVYAMVSGEKRVYLVAGGYSLLGFLNIAQLLYKSEIFAGKATTNIVDFAAKDGFIIAFSVFMVLLTGYFVYVVYSITNNDKIVDIKGLDGSIKDNLNKLFKRNKSED